MYKFILFKIILMEKERYKMLYLKAKDKTRILGFNFVKNNKNKAKLIINNKKYKLKEFLNKKEYKDDIIKINMIFNKELSNGS